MGGNRRVRLESIYSYFYKTLLRCSTNSLMHNCAPLGGLHNYVLLVTHMGVTTEVQQDPLCGLTAYSLLHLSIVMSVAQVIPFKTNIYYTPKDDP